ncbi:unnamed protein product [Rhizoctonia solani]|uniref:Uncharacterized protein n=1 Tax=Rhizoctonia solani TaxID=456999 RepID=A0A8H3HWS3_9AGAM|nr:unnamed protein product [Rhizoctonia solani]
MLFSTTTTMHLIGTYLIIVFSLIAVLAYSLDDYATNLNPSCNYPTTTKLEVNVYDTVESFNIEYLSGGCPSQQQGRWQIVIVVVTTTLFVMCSAWKYVRQSVHRDTRGRSVYLGGRSEAVSGPISGKVSPKKYGSNPINPQSFRGQLAAVISADTARPIPLLRSATGMFALPNKKPEVLNDDTITQAPNTWCSDLLAVAGHHISQIWKWLRIDRSEQALVHATITPRDRGSLHRSLFEGARDLGGDFLEPRRYIFLVIGFDTLEHNDAENDTKYMQQMFESSPRSSTRYECIHGPNATYHKIRETVVALLDEARAVSGPTQIFMLFTGTGDHNNAMCLADGKVLSESDLNRWFSTSATARTTRPISALFDICRTAISRLAMGCQPNELAWSCSVGEFAYAIRTLGDKLIPRSIFLLAIFLAAYDMGVHKLDGRYFEAAFTIHIKQLNELILFMYYRKHQSRCVRCPSRRRCDPPAAQNPDLKQAGRAVTSLGALIATQFPQHAREVFLAVDDKMLQIEFPGRLCPLSASRAKQYNKPNNK